VLFLFVVMMLDINITELRRGFTRFAWLGWLTAVAVVAEIIWVTYAHGVYRGLPIDTSQPLVPAPSDYSNTLELGRALYSQYFYPFELAAMLLLVAIVAAITLTMRQRKGLKRQDVSRQVAVRRRDRVRLVKIPAEKRT
jgi:NADH-quinone oxidoreductase subunit J